MAATAFTLEELPKTLEETKQRLKVTAVKAGSNMPAHFVCTLDGRDVLIRTPQLSMLPVKQPHTAHSLGRRGGASAPRQYVHVDPTFGSQSLLLALPGVSPSYMRSYTEPLTKEQEDEDAQLTDVQQFALFLRLWSLATRDAIQELNAQQTPPRAGGVPFQGVVGPWLSTQRKMASAAAAAAAAAARGEDEQEEEADTRSDILPAQPEAAAATSTAASDWETGGKNAVLTVRIDKTKEPAGYVRMGFYEFVAVGMPARPVARYVTHGDPALPRDSTMYTSVGDLARLTGEAMLVLDLSNIFTKTGATFYTGDFTAQARVRVVINYPAVVRSLGVIDFGLPPQPRAAALAELANVAAGLKRRNDDAASSTGGTRGGSGGAAASSSSSNSNNGNTNTAPAPVAPAPVTVPEVSFYYDDGYDTQPVDMEDAPAAQAATAAHAAIAAADVRVKEEAAHENVPPPAAPRKRARGQVASFRDGTA